MAKTDKKIKLSITSSVILNVGYSAVKLTLRHVEMGCETDGPARLPNGLLATSASPVAQTQYERALQQLTATLLNSAFGLGNAEVETGSRSDKMEADFVSSET